MPVSLKTRLDVAYGCFIPPGAASLLAAIVSMIPMGDGLVGGIGFLVLIPLALAALVSAPIGIYYAIVLRKDAVLLLLLVLTILMFTEAVSEAGSVTFYNATFLVYGILVFVLEASWFLVRRRNYPT